VAEAKLTSTVYNPVYSLNYVGIAGGTAVVGNPGVLGGTTGKVDVYVWNSCTSAWELQQEFAASATTANDAFGGMVAVSGDTLLVGANEAGTLGAGFAYFFTRSGTTWTQLQTVTSPSTTGTRFGWAGAVAGTTAVITSPFGKNPTSSTTYTGAAAIYTKGNNGMFNYQAILVPNEAATNDDFGYSVSLDNGTLVGGAPGSFNWAAMAAGASIASAGKAWVFTGSGSSWTETGYLQPSDGASSDMFGKSVAHAGSTIIVGAPLNDAAASNAGAAYIYTLSGGVWSQTAKLTASDASSGAFFGSTVAALSDTRVLVGAYGAAKIYSFTLSGATWTEDTGTYIGCTTAKVGGELAVSGNLAFSGLGGGTAAATVGGGIVFDLTDPNYACVQ
jgi:hypothetical protein